MRDLAKHIDVDPSAVSRIFAGHRQMKIDEATEIARFLGAPVNEVLKHAGIQVETEAIPTRILLAATINENGVIERLKEPKPLPQSILDRADAAVITSGNERIIAAQVRAATGPLAVFDDAVVLFEYTDSVEVSAIGTLSVCRTDDGEQMLAKIERARKTGEARIIAVSGKSMEVVLQTATSVLAIIP